MCPWYCCFTFDNFLRRQVQDPVKIMKDFVKPGDIVVDIGPGQGYFSIPMASLVGQSGKIYAIDIQQKMLDSLKAKAVSAGVANQITCMLIHNGVMEIPERVDFVLAFWMVHEVPNKEQFMKNVFAMLKYGGLFLIAEPLLHVSKTMIDQTIQIALNNGFTVKDSPHYFFSRSVVLQKL